MEKKKKRRRKKEKGKGSVGAEGGAGAEDGAPPSATSAEDQAAGAAEEPAAISLPARGAAAANAARLRQSPCRPLMPPEGIAPCSICGTVMRGGASALRMHELTSFFSRAMRSGGLEGSVPCPHGCGRKIAANDAMKSFV